MTPPPTNAPEAGSNGEREALARIVFDARFAEVEGWNDDARQANRGLTEPTHLRIADAVVAAGFTRAHHGGERVGRWEAGFRSIVTIVAGPSAQFDIRDIVERVRAILAERDELAAERDSWRQGYMNVANGGVAALAERDAAIRERDEARAAFDSSHTRHAECAGELYAAEVERDAIRAERDALAADRDAWKRKEGDTYKRFCDMTHAAKDQMERAEAAEAKLRGIEDADMGEIRAINASLDASLDASDKRAAALAEALTTLVPILEQWHEEFPQDVGDKEAPALDAARAALAGNGNGTGGDGWIACSERMPDQQLPGHRRGRPALVYVQCDNDAKFIDLEWWDPTSKSWWNTDPKAGQHITHWRPLPAAPPSAGETT